MRKQMFEAIPKDEDVQSFYEILRYENASQRTDIQRLEAEVERLELLVDKLEEKLDMQQETIELYNAELAAVRARES